MWQLTLSFITVAIFTFFKQGPAISIPSQSILPIMTLGIINTGFGCYLYFSSIQMLPAQSVAIWGYLEPLSALIFSALFLAERLTFLQAVGAALILGGATFGECFFSKDSKRIAPLLVSCGQSVKSDDPTLSSK